jgi:hypothetical protein
LEHVIKLIKGKMEEHTKVSLIAVTLIALIGLLFGIYYFLIREKPQPVKPPIKIEKKAEKISEKKFIEKKEKIPELIGIDLNNSDNKIRELAKRISSHPLFISWLNQEDLIRRFTVVVDNIANGESPRPHLQFLAPKGKFKAIKKKGKIFISPESYRRYNFIADVIASLDTKVCAEIYRIVKPLIQQAYKELGYPEKDFDETLKEAIIELLKTPIIEGEIELREKVVTYKIADPKLEELSPAQKHLLRMGTENVLKIQDKLRDLALELGISEDELPEPIIYSTDI